MKIRFRSGAIPEVLETIKKYVDEPGAEYIIEISKKRSLDQNAYFHSVIVPAFCQLTGYTAPKAKKILKQGFEVKSTAELSTIEFEKFCNYCRIWLYHNYRCSIPEPGDITDELLFDLEKTFYF